MTLLTKRIPVSEETWKKLHQLREPGKNYDQLLEEMIREHSRLKLYEKMDKTEKMDNSELVSLDDV